MADDWENEDFEEKPVQKAPVPVQNNWDDEDAEDTEDVPDSWDMDEEEIKRKKAEEKAAEERKKEEEERKRAEERRKKQEAKAAKQKPAVDERKANFMKELEAKKKKQAEEEAKLKAAGGASAFDARAAAKKAQEESDLALAEEMFAAATIGKDRAMSSVGSPRMSPRKSPSSPSRSAAPTLKTGDDYQGYGETVARQITANGTKLHIMRFFTAALNGSKEVLDQTNLNDLVLQLNKAIADKKAAQKKPTTAAPAKKKKAATKASVVVRANDEFDDHTQYNDNDGFDDYF